ncbi:hypothetical protein [Nocardia sp. NPDC004711]
MAASPQLQRITNFVIGNIAVGMCILGAGALAASSFHPEAWSPWSAFVSQLGGLLLATGMVTWAWEQWGRRNFTNEVMDIARLSTELTKSGIKRATDLYLDDIPWSDLEQ